MFFLVSQVPFIHTEVANKQASGWSVASPPTHIFHLLSSSPPTRPCLAMDPTSQEVRLDWLPTEIIFMIVDYLSLHELNWFSLINKRTRAISLTRLFRTVKFPSSKAGFKAMELLFEADAIRPHVASLEYVGTRLLDDGKRDPRLYRHLITNIS